MRFFVYVRDGAAVLGALKGTTMFGAKGGARTSGDLQALLLAGPEAMRQAYDNLLGGEQLNPAGIEYLPPLPSPEKIICFGLNYKDHAAESGFEAPQPTPQDKRTGELGVHSLDHFSVAVPKMSVAETSTQRSGWV